MTRNKRVIKQAEILNIAGKNTLRVLIKYLIRDSKYNKVIRKQVKVNVHHSLDNKSIQIGQKVLIQQSRPISKTKSWILVNSKDSSSKETIQP